MRSLKRLNIFILLSLVLFLFLSTNSIAQSDVKNNSNNGIIDIKKIDQDKESIEWEVVFNNSAVNHEGANIKLKLKDGLLKKSIHSNHEVLISDVNEGNGYEVITPPGSNTHKINLITKLDEEEIDQYEIEVIATLKNKVYETSLDVMKNEDKHKNNLSLKNDNLNNANSDAQGNNSPTYDKENEKNEEESSTLDMDEQIIKIEENKRNKESIEWKIVIDNSKLKKRNANIALALGEGLLKDTISSTEELDIKNTDEGYEITLPDGKNNYEILLTTLFPEKNQEAYQLRAMAINEQEYTTSLSVETIKNSEEVKEEVVSENHKIKENQTEEELDTSSEKNTSKKSVRNINGVTKSSQCQDQYQTKYEDEDCTSKGFKADYVDIINSKIDVTGVSKIKGLHIKDNSLLFFNGSLNLTEYMKLTNQSYLYAGLGVQTNEKVDIIDNSRMCIKGANTAPLTEIKNNSAIFMSGSITGDVELDENSYIYLWGTITGGVNYPENIVEIDPTTFNLSCPTSKNDIKEGTVIAKHVDENGDEIASSEKLSGKANFEEKYFFEPKEIRGYEFLKVDEHGAPASGVFKEETQTVTFIYKKMVGSLTVTKVDEAGNALKGAEFTLTGPKNFESIKTSDENGKVVFSDLEWGDYELKEIKAPEGYRLLNNTINIDISGENLNEEIEVENSKHGWILPDTGGIGTIVFYGVGAILMIAAMLLLFRNKGTKTDPTEEG